MSVRHVLVVLALGVLAGCTAHAPAMRSEPWGNRPAPVVVADVPVTGFRVTVRTEDDNVSGELLAVDACYVHVLGESGTVAIPSKVVESVQVQLYPTTTAGGVTVLSLLGTLSTLSHGWFLVFSFPIWLSSGIATSVNLGYSDDVRVKDGNLLFQFARFPQGLPPGWRVNEVTPGAPAACSIPSPPAAPSAPNQPAPPSGPSLDGRPAPEPPPSGSPSPF